MPDEPKSDPPPKPAIQEIEVPQPGDLNLSEGRKGMVVMPVNGNPGNLADAFAKIDAAPAGDPTPPPPEPSSPPPTAPSSDSE